MGEAVVADSTGDLTPLCGLYLQSAIGVVTDTYLVGRNEHVDQRALSTNFVVIGMAYKPALCHPVRR